jgi:hypothetical protein
LVLGTVCAWVGVAAAQDPPLAIFPSPPAAQEQTVAVDLSHVRSQVAKEMHADPAQVPLTVHLPVSEAAHVCQTTPTELGAMGAGPAQCLAQTTSLVLDMAARKEAQLAQRTPVIAGGPK